ncbi:MAG: diaminopimelate epimerase [Bdellovibrionota bacterium]|nr:diaminopimelate epimerase [Pseudomonadota bacterium]MDY6089836.1 diaminopimelate epimerase [Bdellovibrionota bacterium]
MNFTKMHGIGNDYVYINDTESIIKNPNELSKKISDRHFGIGSDGLILIRNSDIADFKMSMFNADGSEAQMCGNGIRCVAKYVYDNKLTNKKSLKIETLAGIKTLELNVQDGQVFEVTVDMGEPILEPRKIPVNSNLKEFINQEIKVNDTNYFATCVSMGNPHTIIFVKDVDKFRVCEIGKEIENNKELFPQKTNVEFIEVLDAHNLRMRVWERGSGETLACGTGACASLVAGHLNNLCKSQAFVYLKGGILNIKWDKKTNHIFLTGGATKVFDGNFTINEE